MSNSSLVDYTLISPNKTVMKNKINKKITLHHMAGNLTVEQCGKVFQPASRKASANYGVGTDGRIGLYVDEKDRSWASSSSANDSQAVTIEVANDNTTTWHVSDKALEKTIELCVDICKRNGIDKLTFTGDASGNLTAHRFFASTLCPGDYLYSKFPYIAEEVNKRLNQSAVIGWNKDDIGYWYVYSDGSYPVNTWKTIDGKDYYFKSDGYMASDEYIKSNDNNLYYVDKEGVWDLLIYQWKSNNKGWWIEGIKSGWFPKSEWCKVDNKWYYFDKDGYMVTGKVKIGLRTYTFNSDGSLVE